MPEAYESEAVDFLTRAVAKTYHEYEARLKMQEAMDFDDLLMRPAVALRDQPELRARLTQRWTHLAHRRVPRHEFCPVLGGRLVGFRGSERDGGG